MRLLRFLLLLLVLLWAAMPSTALDIQISSTAQSTLPNVTNDAQLKRSANDFSSFTTKATPVSADVLLIEDSAAAGAKKAVTVGSLPGGGVGVTDGDKGEITVAASGTLWTIDTAAVTYAKLQNTSAASVLLGRGAAGAGVPQEITLGSGLTMTGTTLSATATGGGNVSNTGTPVDNQVAVWTTATQLEGTTALTYNAGTLAVGTAGTLGKVTVAGNTSGVVTVQPPANFTSYNFNLPTTAGASGQVLTSGGGVAAPMTWTSALSNPMTSPGDLIVGGAAGAAQRLAAGTGLLRGNGASGPTYGELSGDVTTSGSNVVTVTRVNGASIAANPALDTVPTVTAANIISWRVLPDCDDLLGQHLNYDTATHVWSCGNSTRTVPAFLVHPDAPAIDVDSNLYNEVRIADVTSASVNLNAPTGTPFEGQRLTYSLYSNVSRLLTYTITANGFAAEAGLNFPARTIAGSYLILQFRWSGQSNRWALILVSDRKPKVATFGDVASITINTNTTEHATVALGASTQTSYTFPNPTGTPADAQFLRIRLTTTAGAPAKPLSWGSQFTGNAGLPLPTTTTGNGTQDVFGFVRNEADTTWVLLATTQSSLSARRRTCMIRIGDEADSALTDAMLGPSNGWCDIPTAATIEEVTIRADAGTPSVIPHRRTGTTSTNLVSTALATAAAGGVACARTTAMVGFAGVTCAATLQNTAITGGDFTLGLTSGIAGGTAKRITISIHYLLSS